MSHTRARTRTGVGSAALGLSLLVGAVPTPAEAQTTPVVRLNLGGSAYTDGGGRVWSAEPSGTAGRPTRSYAPVEGTSDDRLYQDRRVGLDALGVPTGNGAYDLTLHFSEPVHSSPGKRVFSVAAEGATVARDLDLFARAGLNRAHTVTTRVQVLDGRLDLRLTATAGRTLLAALELVPAPAPLTVPGTPTGLGATSTSSTSTRVSWGAPAGDGGSPITSYRVTRDGRDSTGAGPWGTTVSSATREFVFDKLVAGASYTFSVTALNAQGESAPGHVSSSPSTPPSTPPSGPVAPSAGIPWQSGVYVPGSSRAAVEAFGAWRGRPVDVVVDWSARRTWSDIVDPTWLYDAWAGTPQTKVFGVAMVPESDGAATLASCATGAFNDKWRQFGTNIRLRGLDDETIVRLGWEFNGNWYKWSAYDTTAFTQCWRHIVASAESTAPALRWDWNVNRGPGQSVADPTRAYPGDAYVDVVGVDSYDGWPGATSEATWQQHYAGAFGLAFWSDFARAHGKKLSVPEWGVYPGTAWAGHNGGDNAFYIGKMVEFFRSQGSHLAYEAYFNEAAPYYAGSLFAPTQAPRAAAEYSRRYHG